MLEKRHIFIVRDWVLGQSLTINMLRFFRAAFTSKHHILKYTFFQLFHMARRTDMCLLIDERCKDWLPTRRGVYDSAPIEGQHPYDA